MSAYGLSFDIGGTFTDLVLVDLMTRKLYMWKVLTTPGEPSRGVANGVEDLLRTIELDGSMVTQPVKGATTLVTNTIIEKSGAQTALVTTDGFRDVLEIGRELRYDIYDLFLKMPTPLVPRHLRYEVRERIDSAGRVVTPLNLDDLSRVADSLLAQAVEAVAICFLHGYKNPAHEEAAAEFLRCRLPEIPVVISAETVAEIREFERTSTTVASAYVAPKVSTHVLKIQAAVRQKGIKQDVYLMHSAGGVIGLETASANPIKLLESGPAAGALGAAHYGKHGGIPHLIALDMGGTTAKISIIDNGTPKVTDSIETARVYRFKRGSGIPIRMPVIDLLEIGAGGGSVAWVDKLGFLKVGPQSSGADPGPACYAQGGTDPTVTDADLVLGYLDPDYFLGGRMTLNRGAAEKSIERKVGESLGLDVQKAAAEIAQVVNENMAIATKIHLIEHRCDPREYALFAFGGAGPVHAREVARRLGIDRVMIPLGSGLLSAVGIHVAPPAMDFIQTDLYLLENVPWTHIRQIYRDLERKGTEMLEKVGVPDDQIVFVRSADMRYEGQGYEVRVPIPNASWDPSLVTPLARVFYQEYERQYGDVATQDVPVEVVNWHLLVHGSDPPSFLQEEEGTATDVAIALKGTRAIYCHERGESVSAAIYDHYRLQPGMSFTGPAVVEQRESTAVLGIDDQIEVDPYRSLIVTINQSAVE